MEEVLAGSEVIVIGNKSPEFRQVLPQLQPDQVIIDLVRISKELDTFNGQYNGICW
jgi:GDP-mannose 6-dehydrogenase